jgi:hypothetical protein
MNISQSSPQFCSHSIWRFYEATVTYERPYVEDGLHRGNTEYGRTCEVQSTWKRLRMPSRKRSARQSSAVVLPREEMAHKYKNNPQLCRAVSISPGIQGIGGHDTHLTVDRAPGIESEHVECYRDEGAHAREGVYLFFKGWLVQDPLRRARNVRDGPILTTCMGDALG